MKLARYLLLLAVAGASQAQINWDNSGNGQLKGTYYFRHVIYYLADQYGDLGRAAAVYGNITFNGDGTYSITSGQATYADSNFSAPKSFTTTGTYSIAASGYGYLSRPYSPYGTTDVVYGMVGKTGIFVGSGTDNSDYANDLMIAAPVGAVGSSGTWQCADFDFSSGNPTTALSMRFALNPTGSSFGNVAITGYVGTSTTTYGQTSSVTYTTSNSAAVAQFPNNGSLIAGQHYLYYSSDGNLLFGGSPTSFDMIVGVKMGSAPTLQKLFYQAGVDETQGDLDSYFGSYYVIPGSGPQTFIGHERINDYGGSSVYDYTYDDQITVGSDGTYTTSYAKYIVAGSGTVEITAGIGPYLGLSVGVQAPTFSGSGVYLDPTGVVNSASNAPFTASIAPGELLTLYGSGLAAATKVAGIPFPTTLGNVQVMIGGMPAAIYYVSATQISAIVPYGITGSTNCSCVQIQVINNNSASNIVTEYLSTSAPGVFTQNQNGTGYGEILRYPDPYHPSVVTAANPAHMGETIAIFLTGLGAVSPTVTDGAAGPSSPTANATGTFTVDFNGTAAAAPAFAGLAPGFSGLYQLNVVVPTGLTVGDNYIDINGPDTYMSYLLIPIAAATSSTPAIETPNARTAPPAAGPLKPARPKKGNISPRIARQ